MNPALTIIVPVYNTARFLKPCLESLLGEDPQQSEILLVDDGSTDESPAMLDAFCRDHPGFRAIHQHNQGLSGARNSALDQARGQYVAFCDSDDFVQPGYYTRMRLLAENLDADVIIGNATYHFEGRQADHPLYRQPLPQGVLSGRDWMKSRLQQRSMLHMVCMQIYRRSLIERLGLRFILGIGHEDVVWTTRFLLAAERIGFTDEPGYYYRQWKRDLHRSDAHYYQSFKSYSINTRELSRLVEEVDDPQLGHLLRWYLVDDGLAMFHKIERMSSEAFRRRCRDDLRQQGIYPLLWRNAVTFSQKRRITKNFLKNLLSDTFATGTKP
ncbi:MAG: glycosyltransferase [Magnetococcus sp. YQC-9]